MLLPAGTRLGPYAILGPLGAGGMGVVYRARDSRLGRDVAVKVLPAAYAADHERLHRFELEAQAAGRLNHPNILAVHDVGTHDGAPYLVTELLEGQTLRERLGDAPLPVRRAVEYAIPIAHGLAAAHDKGIVHRDLKPENLFLTRDGRLKILDFGLAKLLPPAVGGALARDAPTVTVDTDPGTVMGTVNYMSPEQVRAQAVDHRTDIFSLGVILYEMLSGRRAFRRDSAVETMNAILKEEPPELSTVIPTVPPALERVVRHCLEKSPDERFQSARDLAFDLETLSAASGSGPITRTGRPRRIRRYALAAALLAVLALMLTAVYVQGRRVGVMAGKRMEREVAKQIALAKNQEARPATAPAKYFPLTFRRGTIFSARFAPDEATTVYYGAAWDGQPIRLYSTRPGGQESKPLQNANVLSIAADGDMLLSLGCSFQGGGTLSSGIAARLHANDARGGDVLPTQQWNEPVFDADLAPDGKRTVIVREVGRSFLLELLPERKVLYENSAGWISHPRFSRKGDKVAFLDHAVVNDDAGVVMVVRLDGAEPRPKALTGEWFCAQGLAWSAAGEEIWFTADTTATNMVLRGVTMDGVPRIIARAPGRLRLLDISRGGRVLLTHDKTRSQALGLGPDLEGETDLSYFAGTMATDLSADGRSLLFCEQGGSNQEAYTVNQRTMNKSSPNHRMLGEGWYPTFSPDGSKLVCTTNGQKSLRIRSTAGAEQWQSLSPGPIDRYLCARWIPGRDALVFAASEAGRKKVCLYTQEIAGGRPRRVTPEGIDGFNFSVSPDGARVAAVDAQRRLVIFPLEGTAREPEIIPKRTAQDVPVRWSADGGSLYVRPLLGIPMTIDRVDLKTHHREPCLEIKPADPAGVLDVFSVVMTADSKTAYAYTLYICLSDLFLVEGLK